ncbi:glycerol-3-phosphate 1-O-acyltransferase, partial [Gordonia aichiensis]
GGRTRTGKMRRPRYGLLNYLAAAVRSRRVEDVLLVPVSITYERLNELGAIASEQSGGKKKPEGIGWLARYVRSQQHSAGRVYVRFGEPLSARERLGAHGDPMDQRPLTIPLRDTTTGATSVPDESALSETERKAVQRLAFDVAVGINAVTPITVNALVTLALLGVHERALTLGQVRTVVDPVLGYIAQRGLPSGELSTLRDEQGLRVVLEQLALAGVVTVYRGGLEPVYAIEPGAHLEAAFYRNSAVHWFVNRAILELAALTAVEEPGEDPLRSAWKAAFALRDLLKFEFFFPERQEFAEQIIDEVRLIVPEWDENTPDDRLDRQFLGALTDSGFVMAHRVLRSFFDAQLVVAERLAARPADATIDRKEFIDECVAVGKQMLLQQRLHSPESVSTELFTSAWKLAANHGLIGPATEGAEDDLTARRMEFAERLRPP